MRVDTTVVETDIHHPTDSTLLGDGVRVLTRIMRKITTMAGTVGTKLRDRTRSVKLRLLEIGRVARAKGPINQDKLEQRYRQLLDTTSRVVGQARRFSEEIAQGMKGSANALKQLVLEGLRQELDEMTSRVRQVMKQTRARNTFRGNTRSEEKAPQLVPSHRPRSFARARPPDPMSSAKMGEVVGGREPDHHRLRSLRSPAT